MATPKKETLVIERIPFQFQLSEKSEFEAGRFVGVASVWGSVVDTFPNRTRFKRGAFLKTINERSNRVKILANHDQFSTWIGVPTSLRETDEGLEIAVSLNNTSQGKDVAEALRHLNSLGKLDAAELSIGFDSMKDEMVEDEEDGEVFREILEARLWEVSVVNFGADRKTKVMEAASLRAHDFDAAIETIHYLSVEAPPQRHAKTALTDNQRNRIDAAIAALQKLLTPAEPLEQKQALTDYERWRREAEANFKIAEAETRSRFQ